MNKHRFNHPTLICKNADSGSVTRRIMAFSILLLVMSVTQVSGQDTSFTTPGAYTYTVAPGVTSLQISAAGASGHVTYSSCLGGSVGCNLAVYEGEVLYLYVGGQGGTPGSYLSGGAGGYNGGGDGGAGEGSGGGGGGASDIRVGGTSLANRIIVAGGGGGAGVNSGYESYGGNGGGLNGTNGLDPFGEFTIECGSGGTQTAGGAVAVEAEDGTYGTAGSSGSLGQGGWGGGTSGWGGGGGGGGYYGGGGGGNAGGGGGSSYYGGTGVTSATTSTGTNNGNGYITLTVLCTVNIGTISGVSSLCRSTSANLSESVSGGTWSSSTPAIASINSSGQVTGIATGSAIISYTTTDGCGTSSATTIIDIDSINAGAITGSSSICSGSTITLSDITAYGGTGIWSSTNTSSGSVNTVTGVVSGIAGGTTTISYTVTNICGNVSATAVVTVNSVPTVGATGGGIAICSGNTAILSGTGATSYSWSGGISNGVAFTPPVGVNSYTVTGTDEHSCTNTAVTTVTVNTLPTVGSTDGGAICYGNIATLSGTGAVSYSWSGGISNGVAFTPPVGVNNYTVTGTDEHNCTNTAIATVTVNALPIVGTTGGGGICSGNTATLSGTGAVSYSWSGGIANGVAFTPSVGVNSYTVTGTDGHSCTNTAVATVTVNTSPDAGIISGTLSVCTGANTSLTDGAADGLWSADESGNASVDASGNVTGMTVGTATIYYTVTGPGCTAAASATVTVNESPTPIIGPGTVCAGATLSLSATSTGGTPTVFNVTGAPQVYTVPANVYQVNVTLTGGQGGTGTATSGGKGGTTTATIAVTPGQVLNVFVGDGGANNNGSGGTSYNGGGVLGSVYGTGAGGGASDIRIGGTALSNRIIVAGGGGGGGFESSLNGGAGGGASGMSGGFYPGTTAATGGTQTAGGTGEIPPTSFTYGISGNNGSLGQGGNMLTDGGGGAGGGGYYGGGGGDNYDEGGGAGGSSYADPTTTSDVVMTQGTNTSYTGMVTITPLFTNAGVWASSSANASVVGSTGVVTGESAGTANISFTIADGCQSTTVVTVNPSADAGSITGTAIVCAGSTTNLTDGAGGGVWSSGNTSIATVGTNGVVTGAASGTVTISYTATNSCGSNTATVILSVNALPVVSITGGGIAICSGNTATLSGTGATSYSWSGGISNGVAFTPSTGVNTYTVTGTTGSCSNTATATVTVNPLPSAGTITGASNVSVGSNINLTDATTGGNWSASNGDATVAGGVVTGITAGSVIISYGVTNGCGTTYATSLITISGSSINGASVICAGTTTTLTNATTGGTWSMESLVATINSSTGVLTASTTYTGTATVTYTAGALSATIVITVNPNPTPIQVAASACAGTTVTLSDATIGGAWSGTGDATISGTGTSGTFVAGAVAGSVMITYTLPSGCYLTTSRSVYASPLPITGAFNVCVGGVTNLSDASPVLNWFSSNTAVATVLGSNVTGVSSGTTIITFQSSATGYCITTQVVTVSAQPASITGNSGALCPGSTEALADGAGTWTSSSTAVATIASTGVVTGVAGGTTIVSYLEAGTAGCTANTVVTVNTVAAITGSTAMCLGGTTVLNDATTGGTWLSGAPGTATVNAAGLVTGTGEGTAMITYTTAGGCAKTVMVTVSGVSAAISGNLFLCNGTTTTLSDASAGGTWSMSSNIATAGSATGIITASASYTGTATISYVSGSCSVSAVLTVSAHPAAIQGAAGECAGVTTSLTDVTAGGTWNVSGDATISGSGASATLVAGATGGTAIVSYSLGTGCMVTSTNTIYAGPQPITGNFNLCVGLVTDLTDASPVNSWSSSNTAIATVAGPDVTGHAVGVATITFKSSAAGYCITTQTITVNAMPVVTAINGPATISNVGSPVSISDATVGGIWTSSNTSVITLSGSTGSSINATALTTTGSSIITYAVTIAGCTTKVTRTYGAPAASHPDSGKTTVYTGSEVSVADDVTGGIWSSSDNGIATVDGNGSVTGIIRGNVNITHEITGDDGAVTTSVINVIVDAAPVIINVLPNPNKGVFTVRGTVGSMADELVTFEVTDLLGQVIYRSKVTAYEGKLNETITLSNALANGMYILNVQCAMETKTFHFVVEQ